MLLAKDALKSNSALNHDLHEQAGIQTIQGKI